MELDAVSRRRSSTSRSSSPARCSSGASRSSGATDRSASATRPVGPLALLGRERRGGRGRALGELGDVPEPLALGAELLLGPGSSPSVSSTSARSSASRASANAAFAVSSSCRRRAARSSRQAVRARRAAAELLLAAEPVEHLELVRRLREAPLLELAGHRDDALDGGGDVLPRRGASPRVGARPPVGEHAARDDERVLVLGPQLGELLELLREVELRLDVGLLAGGADERVVALRAEQQPDRLGEDRLARAGLARDRVQPGRELELGLADEDEVLDAQAPQHAGDRRPAARRRPLAL